MEIPESLENITQNMSYIHKYVRAPPVFCLLEVPMAMCGGEMEKKYFQRLTLMTVFAFNFAFLNLPASLACLWVGLVMYGINEISECSGHKIPH